MRARSTWQQPTQPEGGSATPRQAATQRKADIYTMNQEHPQPSPIDYESGNPDTWAESQHGYSDVEDEYENGHVKRNELNFAEFRENTWKHKDSDVWHSGKGNYDNVKDGEGKFENPSGKSSGESPGRSYEAAGGRSREAAGRKAKAVERIARAFLRTSNEKLVEAQALDLLTMPDHLVVATLKRLDAVSPDSLTPDSKNRRALACTKLAARLLGDAVPDEKIEVLASTIMGIDDPTLKSILRQVATARVAQQEEEEEQGSAARTSQQQQEEEEQQEGRTSQQEEQGQEGSPPPPPPAKTGQQEQEQQTSQQQQQQSQEQQQAQQQQEGNALPPQELALLDQMLKEEMGQCAPMAPGAPGAPAGDDLTALFEAAPAPVMAPPVAAPAMASSFDYSDVTFGDDDEMDLPPNNVASVAPATAAAPATAPRSQSVQALLASAPPVQQAPAVAGVDPELTDLFSDHPEVQAQREITAAAQEQQVREGGFQVGRTASSKGARKIGQVVRGKPANVDQVLENIWDRP